MNKYVVWIFALLFLVSSVNAINITSPNNNSVINTSNFYIAFSSSSNLSYADISLFNTNSSFISNFVRLTEQNITINDTNYTFTLGASFNNYKSYYPNINQFLDSINLTYSCDHSCDAITMFVFDDGSAINSSTISNTGTYKTDNFNNTIKNKRISRIDLYFMRTSINTPNHLIIDNIKFISILNNSYYANFASLNVSTGIYNINISGYNSTDSIIDYGIVSNITFNTNSLLNITVKNPSNTLINNFNLSLTDTVTGIKTNYTNYNGSIILDVVRYRPYNYSIVGNNYLDSNSSYTILNMPSQNLNITMGYPNSINIRIYNTSSNKLINTSNTTITIFSPTTSKTYTTATGATNITYLDSGVNLFTFTNALFSTTSYSLDIVYGNNYSLDAYLIPTATSSNVTFTFFDIAGAKISNMYVEEYVLSNSSYVLAQSSYSDIIGRVYFNYNPSYSYYYTYSKSGFRSNSFVLAPPREANYDITVITSNVIPNYATVNVTGSSSFNNLTKSLTFSYVSTDPSIATYSYTVSKVINAKYTVLCSGSSVLIQDYFNCDLTSYTGDVFVQGVANNTRPFYGEYVSLGDTTKLKDILPQKESAFITAFILIIVVFAGLLFGVTGTLIFGVIGVLLVFWIGLASILTVGLILADIVINIVIIAGFKRR